MNKIKVLIIVLSVIIVTLIAGLVFTYQKYQSATLEQMASATLLAEERRLPTLPMGAVKLSECIPHEGEHWVVPKDLPYGPFYSTYNGKVISTEYMFTEDSIPGKEGVNMSFDEVVTFMNHTNLSFSDLVKNSFFGFDLFDHRYKSFDIHWSAPHAGFDTPHIDVHFFLVDKSELENICPDAKIENVYSEEILKAVDEHNIPFPGKTSPTPSITKPPTQPSIQPTVGHAM